MIDKYYDDKYFAWQVSVGEFGGWADQKKFLEFISPESIVLDFGCGGGFLLKEIVCGKKLGVEVNPYASELAKKNNIEVFEKLGNIKDNYVDVIISNHALEHCLNPLEQLTEMHKKLKASGIIVLVVPCESIACKFKQGDINQHLYSWSPMCIGNLLTEAGFCIIESKAYFHKWPPKHRMLRKIAGVRIFNFLCQIYGSISRSKSQVRVIAKKER